MEKRKEKGKETVQEEWKPITQLGKAVKAGEVTDIEDIFNQGLTIIEPEVVDTLLPNI